MEKRVLDLPLKAKWYDMIESGEKTEEYREIKSFWEKRLRGKYPTQMLNGILIHGGNDFKHYDEVKFRYGYTKRTMTFECLSIREGFGRKDWGAPDERVFIIKLGKRIN